MGRHLPGMPRCAAAPSSPPAPPPPWPPRPASPLRQGLKFHDGEPVRAQDCAASIRRWATRDAFGQALWAATDSCEAADDRTLRFRLKKPFPLLPDALAKVGTHFCAVMPERHANLP